MTTWIEMKRHFEVRSLEWFGGFYLFCWGAYVILHPRMMENVPVIFGGMLDLAPTEWWGLGAFAIGGIRLGALWVNGRWSVTPLIRVVTSFLSVFVWFWICVGLYRSNTDQTGLAIYPGLLLADVFSAFRAASDAYEAEALRRIRSLTEQSNVEHFRRSA